MVFMDNLKTLRLQDGLTQGELAERIGVGKSTISMWEKGDRTPSLEMLETLADFFNVSLSELWGDEKKPAAMDGSGLSEEEMEIIDLLRAAPPEARMKLVEFLKSAGFGRDTQDDPAKKR